MHSIHVCKYHVILFNANLLNDILLPCRKSQTIPQQYTFFMFVLFCTKWMKLTCIWQLFSLSSFSFEATDGFLLIFRLCSKLESCQEDWLIAVDRYRTYSLSCFTSMLHRPVTFHNRISSQNLNDTQSVDLGQIVYSVMQVAKMILAFPRNYSLCILTVQLWTLI